MPCRPKRHTPIKPPSNAVPARDYEVSVIVDQWQPDNQSPDAEQLRLFSVLDALPAFVYLKAPDYTIRFANRCFWERFGDPSRGPCFEVIHGRAEPCEPCACAAVFEDQRPVESEWSFPDGSSYQLHDYPYVDADGTAMVLHLGIDITQRKQAEAELERTNRELLALTATEHKERVFAEGLVKASLALNTSLDVSEVLDSILEQIQEVIPCRAATILVLQNGQVHLERQRGIDPGSTTLQRLKAGVALDQSPVLAQACREQRPVVVSDTSQNEVLRTDSGLDWARSLAVVPMVQEGETVGFIALLGKQPAFFDEETIRRLEAFANHAVVAIRNARLFQAEADAARTAQFLSAASLALTQTLDLDTVLCNLLDLLTYLVPYEWGTVSLLTDDADLVLRASRGSDRGECPGNMRAIAGGGVETLRGAHSIPSIESVWLEDTAHHPEWTPPRGAEQTRSYLAVPLIVDGRAIGLCELHSRQAGALVQQHVWWAETLSGQAAVAIQNAHLFQQMSESRAQLQSLSRRLVQVQENERRYVARELHDEAGQALTSLMIQLKLLQRMADDPPAVHQATGALIEAVEEVMDNLHRLAMDLRPASLDHVGLVAALRQYCEALGKQHGLAVRFEALGIHARLRPAAETALYRIVQEALTNVVRHARASRVDVVLERRDGWVIAIVEDDGLGFDAESAVGTTRLGLLGMRERAEALGGKLAVESSPHQGTTILAEVPYDD